MSGLSGHLTGQAAEAAVERHYHAAGCATLERRWRGPGGEIDLILRAPCGTVVFVEVKAARGSEAAGARLGARQIARLTASAGDYLGTKEAGLDSPARFDVALVDGQGRVSVIENALM